MLRGLPTFQERLAMDGLRNELVRRKKRIMDQALLTSLEFTPVERGQFTAVARWEGGECRVGVTAGGSLRRGRSVYRMPFCRYVDELIGKILKARRIQK